MIYTVYHKNYAEVLQCRRFGLSTFWFVDVTVCRRFGLSTFWFVDVSVCRRFGLSTFWFVDVSVCRRFGLSTFWFVDVSVCRRFGLSTFWLSTFRFVDVLTSNHCQQPCRHCQHSLSLATTLPAALWSLPAQPVIGYCSELGPTTRPGGQMSRTCGGSVLTYPEA